MKTMKEKEDEFEKKVRKAIDMLGEPLGEGKEYSDEDAIRDIVKFKAQILADNPLAGLSNKQIQAFIDIEGHVECEFKKHNGYCEICEMLVIFKKELPHRKEKEDCDCAYQGQCKHEEKPDDMQNKDEFEKLRNSLNTQTITIEGKRYLKLGYVKNFLSMYDAKLKAQLLKEFLKKELAERTEEHFKFIKNEECLNEKIYRNTLEYQLSIIIYLKNKIKEIGD